MSVTEKPFRFSCSFSLDVGCVQSPGTRLGRETQTADFFFSLRALMSRIRVESQIIYFYPCSNRFYCKAQF